MSPRTSGLQLGCCALINVLGIALCSRCERPHLTATHLALVRKGWCGEEAQPGLAPGVDLGPWSHPPGNMCALAEHTVSETDPLALCGS